MTLVACAYSNGRHIHMMLTPQKHTRLSDNTTWRQYRGLRAMHTELGMRASRTDKVPRLIASAFIVTMMLLVQLCLRLLPCDASKSRIASLLFAAATSRAVLPDVEQAMSVDEAPSLTSALTTRTLPLRTASPRAVQPSRPVAWRSSDVAMAPQIPLLGPPSAPFVVDPSSSETILASP